MRKIFLLITGILIGSSLHAQSFSGGISAGLTASQVDGDTYSGYHRAGFAAGASVGLDLSPKFAWQMELKYIQKGSYKRQNPDAGDYSIYKLRLNYVEMPLMIKYKFKPKIIFDAGIGIGYLMKTVEEDEYGVFPVGTAQSFHKAEISYQIGGYYLLSKKLSFNIRYNYSLLAIRNHVAGERWILFQKGQFNNVFVFSLCYQLNKSNDE